MSVHVRNRWKSLGIVALVMSIFVWGWVPLACSPSPGTQDGQGNADSGTVTETTGGEGTSSEETTTQPDSDTGEPAFNPDTSTTAEPTATPDKSPQPDTSTNPDVPVGPDTKPSASACNGYWSQVSQTFSDATNLTSCDGDTEAQQIVTSLMVLEGIQIDNNGTKETPCIDVKCDSKWVYVVSNALPHYDFVQTTPNALKASTLFFRLARKPIDIASNVDAEDFDSMKGCAQAFTQFASSPNQGTNQEPSGYCIMGQNGKNYMKAKENGQTVTFRKISCLGTIGFSITGVPVFGPNEGPMPDPWGNPVFFSPDKAGDPYVPSNLRGGAALDLCLGHTAQTMHYHGFNEACFERDSQGKPKSSYAVATSTWDYKKSLDGDCTKVSGIVGWSSDGVPIKGPCVCMKRNPDGSCASIKRARSGYVYRGLGAWGTTQPSGLAKDGAACSQKSDCCTDVNNCKYQCKYTVVDSSSAAGGSAVERRCVLRDYTWCIHHFVDRSSQNMGNANYVYMDRCNGVKSADGYSYHATTTFPHVIACTRYESKDAVQTGAGHGGNNNCQRDSDCQQGQTCQNGQCQGGQQGNCQRDSDCQQGQTCQNSQCQGGGTGPKSCTSDNDCSGACPQGSQGCKCNNSPNGKICVPTCTKDADCPQGPQQMRCDTNGGICIPQRP